MKKRKIKGHPVRIFVYFIFYGITVGMYFLLGSYFFWMFGILLAVAPVISIANAYWLAGNLQVKIGCEESMLSKDETGILNILMENPYWYGASLHCESYWEISNTFLETASEISLSVPLIGKGKSSLGLPLRGEKLGKILFSCTQIKIRDLLSLVYVEVEVFSSQEFFVLPKKETDLNP